MGCTGSAGMPLPEPADRVFAVPRGRARIGAGVAIDRDCRGCYRIDAVVRNGFVESFAVRHDRIVFQSGPYSNYLAVIVPVAFYYVLTLRAVPAVLSASKGRARFVRLSNPDTLIYYASWLFLLLALVVLPATRGRIAWLAVLGSGLVAVCRETPAPAYIRKFYRRRKFLFATIGSAVLVLVVVSLVGLYRYKRDSAGGRWLIWNVSAQLIRENPAFGVGTGCFAGAYGNAQEAANFVSGAMTEDQVRVAGAPDYAFNDFLQITVETGAAGALLFLSVVVLSFRGLARRRTGCCTA